MWFEVIRWVTLAILWGCIGLNVWSIIRNWRQYHYWQKEFRARLKEMEEWFESYCRALTKPEE